jgi:hypothetical protein
MTRRGRRSGARIVAVAERHIECGEIIRVFFQGELLPPSLNITIRLIQKNCENVKIIMIYLKYIR